MTKEPKSQNRFVVHEHHAKHLHWDLRLEMEGVLKSWAVPRGVPEKAGIRRLAILVEDHSVEYINFKGTIPPGCYGTGEVKIWDKGKYKLIEKISKEIRFKLFGKRLKGKYILRKFKDKNWLLFKIK